MSKFEQLVQRTLEVVQQRSTTDFYRYYLREKVPTQPQFEAEGVVVLAPDNIRELLFTTLLGKNRKPISAEEYYEAILRAELPSRAHAKEAEINVPLDEDGVILEHEYKMAVMIAEMSNSPLVASVLYRSTESTELLVEFLSILPMRPSDGLRRMKNRVQDRLTR